MRRESFDVALTALSSRQALAALLILDDLLPDRLTALARFWAAIKKPACARRPPVTPQRASGALADAPRRRRPCRRSELPPDRRAALPEPQTRLGDLGREPVRETTVRLARDGLAFVRGGYRKILGFRVARDDTPLGVENNFLIPFLSNAPASRHGARNPPLVRSGNQRATGGAIMAEIAASIPQRYLRTQEAARFLGLSERTLEKHRTYEPARPVIKPGGQVVTCGEDLGAWHPGSCTPLDLTAGTVLPAKRQPKSPPPPAGAFRAEDGAPCRPATSIAMSVRSSICSGRCPAILPAMARPRRLSIFFRCRAPTLIDFKAGSVKICVEAVAEHGMATIWDADVLIWAASQIVEARDLGLRAVAPNVATTPYEILNFIGRRAAARLSTALSARNPTWFLSSSRWRRPSVSRPSGGCTASPGSTSGRNAPITEAARRARTDSPRLVLRRRAGRRARTHDRPKLLRPDRRAERWRLPPGAQARRSPGVRLSFDFPHLHSKSAAPRRSSTSPTTSATSSNASRSSATA